MIIHDGDKIEVTPEMMEAGALAHSRHEPMLETTEEAAVSIYSAMERARSAELRNVIALDQNGRVLVKRDMELIRRIFTAIESRKDAQLRSIEIPGVDETVVSRHLEMLLREGLIEGSPSEAYNSQFKKILVKDLSWEGHDAAAALANEDVWNKIKKSFSSEELARLPLETIVVVAIELLTKWALSKVGLTKIYTVGK